MLVQTIVDQAILTNNRKPNLCACINLKHVAIMHQKVHVLKFFITSKMLTHK